MFSRCSTRGLSTARVAVAQITSTSDKQQNFQSCRALAVEAASTGAKLLALPECFNFIGSSAQETIEQSESIFDGPSIALYRNLARETGIWLSLGGFHESVETPDHSKMVYNSHIIINSDGEIVAFYRKIHLFDVDIPNGPVMLESKSTLPGDQVIVLDSPIGKLGLSTCYDVRFPELYISLLKKGAEVILVPSAFTVPTGRAHWEILLRARAIENQAYVLASAQVGTHNLKRESWGHAMIVDPWGEMIGNAGGPENSPTIIIADIDRERLNSVRMRIPIQSHRRNDIFFNFTSIKNESNEDDSTHNSK